MVIIAWGSLRPAHRPRGPSCHRIPPRNAARATRNRRTHRRRRVHRRGGTVTVVPRLGALGLGAAFPHFVFGLGKDRRPRFEVPIRARPYTGEHCQHLAYPLARLGALVAAGGGGRWGHGRYANRPSPGGLLPSGHATAGTPVGRTAFVDAVVGDKQLARIAVEGLQRHAGRREEVLANRGEAPRRDGGRAAREPGEDPLLDLVERFVGQLLLELAVGDTDVDAELVGAVGHHVGRRT